MKLYEVEPFDIALLNDQDREHFFVKLKQMIHVLDVYKRQVLDSSIGELRPSGLIVTHRVGSAAAILALQDCFN